MSVDLKKLVKKLKEKYSMCSTGEDLSDNFEYISTGNLAFDLISDGGVPWGHSVEFLGLSQSGKSLFIQKIIANAIRDYNAIGVLVDRENAYTKQRGEELGIDNSKLLLAKPADTPTMYEGFQFIIDSLINIRDQEKNAKKENEEDNRTYIVAAIDSIAAFDKDTDLGKADAGRKAKAAHEGFRALLPIVDNKIVILIANQVTYKIGVLYGNNRTSTSGESMKYYNTVRFALEDRLKIVNAKHNNEVIGNHIGVEVIKTRLGPCYRNCYVRHLYKTGIDYYSGYARFLANRGYVKPKNKKEFNSFKQSTLKYDDKEFNEFKIEKFLELHPELLFDKFPDFKEE